MSAKDVHIHVRGAKRDDWKGVYEILQDPQVIRTTGHLVYPSEDSVKERWEARLSEPRVHTLVADVEGRVGGYVRLKQGKGRASHVGEVSIIAVHRDWQGKGVGTALMKAIVDMARTT